MIKKIITPSNLSAQFVLDTVASKININVDGTSILADAVTGVISAATDPAKVDALITLSGLPALSTDLATFTGTTIPDAASVKSALQALETALESQNIVGQYAGSSATFAGLPTTTADTKAVNNSDWAILTALDGVNIPGIYAFDGTVWSFVKEIPAQFALAATVAPLDNVLVASVGVSDKYAREDHQHAFQGISSDATQLLKVGTDGKHVLLTADILALHTAAEEVQDAFGVTLFFAHTTTNM